jgi:hypothetical protein
MQCALVCLLLFDDLSVRVNYTALLSLPCNLLVKLQASAKIPVLVGIVVIPAVIGISRKTFTGTYPLNLVVHCIMMFADIKGEINVLETIYF